MLERLAAAGAELIVGGHTHQAAICERREFEVLDGDARSCVLATAPGLGRPRAGRRYEVRGVLVHRADARVDRVETHVWRRRRVDADGDAHVPARARDTAERESCGRGSPVATMESMEPPITHRDVTTVMALLGDIQVDVERIRELLEDEDDGEEEATRS